MVIVSHHTHTANGMTIDYGVGSILATKVVCLHWANKMIARIKFNSVVNNYNSFTIY